jgi:hypothetical protein
MTNIFQFLQYFFIDTKKTKNVNEVLPMYDDYESFEFLEVHFLMSMIDHF